MTAYNYSTYVSSDACKSDRSTERINTAQVVINDHIVVGSAVHVGRATSGGSARFTFYLRFLHGAIFLARSLPELIKNASIHAALRVARSFYLTE